MQKGPHVSHYGFDVVLKADLLHLTNKGTFSVITCHSTRASVTIYCFVFFALWVELTVNMRLSVVSFRVGVFVHTLKLKTEKEICVKLFKFF